jgi:hypothetical protein
MLGICNPNCDLTLDADICQQCFGSSDSTVVVPGQGCPADPSGIEYATCVLQHEVRHACEWQGQDSGAAVDACPICATEANAWTEELPCTEKVWNYWCNPASAENDEYCEFITNEIQASKDAAAYFACLCEHRIAGTNFYQQGTCDDCVELDSSGYLRGYCEGLEW